MAVAGDRCLIRFRVRAQTDFGDTLVLVGGGVALGDWDPWVKGVPLSTTPEDYPVWSTPAVLCEGSALAAPLEYKYVRLLADGGVVWEAEGDNRKVPQALRDEAMQHFRLFGKVLEFMVDDGDFGRVPCECFGFPAHRTPSDALRIQGTSSAGGPHLLVLGDEVAGGSGVWCFNGWAAKLATSLHQHFGYSVSARVGDIDIYKADKDFQGLIESSPMPNLVLIAFSAGLSHVATCPDWDREPSCNAFIEALESIVSKVFAMGAYPIIAGLCPHSDCGETQSIALRRANDRMRGLGAPMLDWLHTLSKGHNDCTWADRLSCHAARPNRHGHEKMFASIDLSVFDPAHAEAVLRKRAQEWDRERTVFSDGLGLEVSFAAARRHLVVGNRAKHEYSVNAGWAQLQDALAAARRESPWCLQRGLYLCFDPYGASAAVALDSSGRIVPGDQALIPAGRTLVLQAAEALKSSAALRVVFEAGPLSILQCKASGMLLVMNAATFEYNVHPMWNEARLAMRVLEEGIYEDDSGQPFRTAIVSLHGLQSRIKVPAGSALRLRRIGPLRSLERVALLPLGDRCSIRMLLHKIELDGPCYPFDLTRTTSLADVADIVGSGFEQMWYEELLHYDRDAGRIFHKRWAGLSFAHEVDDGDDPVNDFHPIAVRMAKRYAGRAARFDFAVKHSDRVLFLRTGCASRGEVENLLQRLYARYPGLNASLLLISDQPSHEFHDIPGMTHVCESFDPDRMYEDMNYWINSAHRFRGILERFGITARTIYWCPNNLREAEKELRESADKAVAAEASLPSSSTPEDELQQEEHVAPPLLSRASPNFSHSRLFELGSCVAASGKPGSPMALGKLNACGAPEPLEHPATDLLRTTPDTALGA